MRILLHAESAAFAETRGLSRWVEELAATPHEVDIAFGDVIAANAPFDLVIAMDDLWRLQLVRQKTILVDMQRAWLPRVLIENELLGGIENYRYRLWMTRQSVDPIGYFVRRDLADRLGVQDSGAYPNPRYVAVGGAPQPDMISAVLAYAELAAAERAISGPAACTR